MRLTKILPHGDFSSVFLSLFIIVSHFID